MKLIERIDNLILESQGQHYWLVLRVNDETGKSLNRGELEGLQGISGSRGILRFHMGRGKCALKMSRSEVHQINKKPIRIGGMPDKRFLTNNLNVLQRLFDEPTFGTALSTFLRNYIKPQRRVDFVNKTAKYFDDHSFYRFVDEIRGSEEIFKIDLTIQTFHRFSSLIKRLVYKFSKSIGKPDEDILDLRTSELQGAIEDSIKKIKEMYSSEEDEYLVSGSSFNVPEGSELFAMIPEFSDSLEKVYQDWKNGVDNPKIEIFLSAREMEFKNRINTESVIEDYNLNNIYDVKFVTDKEEIN